MSDFAQKLGQYLSKIGEKIGLKSSKKKDGDEKTSDLS
jgi:hypothetical protein